VTAIPEVIERHNLSRPLRPDNRHGETTSSPVKYFSSLSLVSTLSLERERQEARSFVILRRLIRTLACSVPCWYLTARTLYCTFYLSLHSYKTLSKACWSRSLRTSSSRSPITAPPSASTLRTLCTSTYMHDRADYRLRNVKRLLL